MYEIGEARNSRSDKEEPEKAVENLTCGKLARGSDDTPNNGCRAKNSGARAAKAVFLVLCTDVRNVGKDPRLDAKLNRACYCSC